MKVFTLVGQNSKEAVYNRTMDSIQRCGLPSSDAKYTNLEVSSHSSGFSAYVSCMAKILLRFKIFSWRMFNLQQSRNLQYVEHNNNRSPKKKEIRYKNTNEDLQLLCQCAVFPEGEVGYKGAKQTSEDRQLYRWLGMHTGDTILLENVIMSENINIKRASTRHTR